jgi:hypothetical protein
MRTFSLPALLFLPLAAFSAKTPPPPSATFYQPDKITTDVPPAAVAVGDVNGDGLPDIVTANTPLSSGGTGPANTVSVLLNQGNGTFGIAPRITVGTDPVAIAVGDFNGDGTADLIVGALYGSSGLGDIELLVGNGDGTFQPAKVIATNVSSPLAVADFNGDGFLDIAVEGPSGIVVFLGTGTGTFTQLAPNSNCGAVEPFAVGDFNNDGIPDIASLCKTKASTDALVVLLGNGDGTFSAGQTLFAIGTDVQGGGVAAASFTGTANLDLAISLTGPYQSPQLPGTLLIYTGDGQGTFTASQTYNGEVQPGPPVAADFNGDGVPDIAVPNAVSDTVSVYLSTGGGTFSGHRTWAVGAYPLQAAVGDFDQNGNMDLAVGDNAEETVAVLLGTGTGTFDSPLAMPATSPLDTTLPTLLVATADFNNDGNPDIATSAGTIFLGNGLGSFTQADPVSPPLVGSALLAAKLTSSGNADIVLGSQSQLTVLLGAGNATFSTLAIPMPGPVLGTIEGDFNGDGSPDLVVLVGGTSAAGAYLLLGDNMGDFQTPQLVKSGTYSFGAAGVFKSGQPLSLVLIDESLNGGTSAFLLLGNGNGTFKAEVKISTGLTTTSALLVQDVSGDGILDIVAAGTSAPGEYAVSVLLGEGDDNFGKAKLYAFPASIPALAAAGFDGDGNVDLAVSQPDSIQFLLGEGGGVFVQQSAGVTAPGANSIAVSHLTKGAAWDLVAGNAQPDSVWTFLNTTPK